MLGKSSHVVACPSPSTSAAGGDSTSTRGGRPIYPSTGESSHRVWEGPFGQNVLGSMAGRSALDNVVCPTLSEQSEIDTQDVFALRQPDGGKSRAHRRADHGHTSQSRSTSQQPDHWKGSWQVIAKGQGQVGDGSPQGSGSLRACRISWPTTSSSRRTWRASR